jgi:hypothetical protein
VEELVEEAVEDEVEAVVVLRSATHKKWFNWQQIQK